MVRPIRFFCGIAFLASVVLIAKSHAGRSAFAADEPKAEKKESKKIEMPKLPEGSNPKWDLESVEEKFTVVKGSINDTGSVYFLLELKEDIASTATYLVVFTDSEGVKFNKTYASCEPKTGKKGDRVRLVFLGAYPASSKETWIKAVKVQIVAE